MESKSSDHGLSVGEVEILTKVARGKHYFGAFTDWKAVEHLSKRRFCWVKPLGLGTAELVLTDAGHSLIETISQ
jgi:hypothetical protein